VSKAWRWSVAGGVDYKGCPELNNPVNVSATCDQVEVPKELYGQFFAGDAYVLQYDYTNVRDWLLARRLCSPHTCPDLMVR